MKQFFNNQQLADLLRSAADNLLPLTDSLTDALTIKAVIERLESMPDHIGDATKKVESAPRIPLNDETKWILGRICFVCVPVAQVLRAMGHDVPKKAELEQAHAIHWMLNLYLEYGDNWREVGTKILKDATEKQKAANID